MKNIVFINAVNLSEYAFMQNPAGKSAFNHVSDYAQVLEDVEKIIILTDFPESPDIKNIIDLKKYSIIARDSWTIALLFSVIEEECRSYDNLFYIYGDCPFLDTQAAGRMYKNHIKYSAQYSFGDGGPYGILPEIIACEIAGALKVLSEKDNMPVERSSVFTVIQKDINSFDIETDISDTDLRLLRITLTADTKRNYLLVENFISQGCRTEKDIFKAVEEKPEILRTLPAYFMIQIADRCYQSCSYCPYPLINPDHLSGTAFMDPEKYSTILNKISKYCDDAVISLSMWGEPSAHPEIEKLIRQTLQFERFRLIIETSGTGWNHGTLETLSTLPEKEKERLSWIVSLDSDSEVIYEKLRGDGFKEAFETAEKLNELFRENCYFQAVRMTENEEILEKFYKKCKEKNINIIIQKYDFFSSFLPERKVTDISPLKRLPCWHLKRDMHILLDGTVPMCREDVREETILGNIFSSTVEEIWNNGESIYLDHLAGNYKEICRRCDEFYTYNF